MPKRLSSSRSPAGSCQTPPAAMGPAARRDPPLTSPLTGPAGFAALLITHTANFAEQNPGERQPVDATVRMTRPCCGVSVPYRVAVVEDSGRHTAAESGCRKAQGIRSDLGVSPPLFLSSLQHLRSRGSSQLMPVSSKDASDPSVNLAKRPASAPWPRVPSCNET